MLRLLPAIVVLATLGSIFSASRLSDSAPSISPDLSPAAVPQEVLVRLHPEGFSLSDDVLDVRLGGAVKTRIPELRTIRVGLVNESVAEAIERLSRLAIVELVEPNHLVRHTALPNDPYFSAQSHYLNTIEAPSAWDVAMGRDSVLVAVLDSGIDLTHEDLTSGIWTNVFEIAGNGQDDDRNGCVDDLHGCSFVAAEGADPSCHHTGGPGDVRDDNGHGTFVSGIIAARGHNSIGVIGAAPAVTLLPVKILDCLGGGTAADAAQAILYAGRVGARVINLSFGADGESATLASAIREAFNRYGMIVVAATGNQGLNRVSFPARLPETLAVGSSGTPTDPLARSPFSDWGPQVDVVAPGLNIVSTVPLTFCGQGWLCVENRPYAVASGTSFAVPLVTGLAALIVSHNPNISPAAVNQMIARTAEPLPDGETPNWDGAGRIRMRAALNVPRFFVGTPGIVRQ